MRIKFLFKNGWVFEVGDNDYIGVRAFCDEEIDPIWTKSCNTKKTLFQALNAGKWLFAAKKSGSYAVNSGEVVEAKVIEDGKETLLWRGVTRSRVE